MLDDVFPQGLDAVETPARARLRSAYEEWCEAVDENDPKLDELHQAWIRLVLQDFLEYDDSVLIENHSLAKPYGVRSPEGLGPYEPKWIVRDGAESKQKPKIFIDILPPKTRMRDERTSNLWKAPSLEKMTVLCREHGVRLGLLTNGEQWMLVNAPVGSVSSDASWYARLWFQEPLTLKAFASLMGVRRCFGPEKDSLAALLEESLNRHEEITNTLGEQVKNAVEVLVQRLDQADADRGRKLLPPNPTVLYEACLTVMMRLVFILCAEQRRLLLLNEPIYDQFYAASTLREKLQEAADQHGEEILEHRFDAWPRLLSLFRMVYGGFETESLRLPALGGALFDPDRFPFLEGRESGTSWTTTRCTPLPIDNRTVLHLMTALEVLEQGTGALLLSYRSLDVEQIGHVYEGLLEYTVKRLDRPTLGLERTKAAKNPNITLAELESARLDGDETLVQLVHERTKKSASAIQRLLDKPLDDVLETRINTVCTDNKNLAERVKPFGNLLRLSVWDYPIIYGKDSFIVTLGPDRRETGTHYTPKSLTEEIVRTTLEPLVYDGFSDGKPIAKCRLKEPHEILSLKICDPAMGSGAFLVQVCRWLGARLLESWAIEEKKKLRIDILGRAVAELNGAEPMPTEPNNRRTMAMRLIAERCLYGVDINPLAVELAKLSIWLVTMSKGKPSGFLDHNFRNGDSLSGEPLFPWREEFPEVFGRENPGFDAIVGNPPFMGGRKLRKFLGDAYLKRLKAEWPHASLNADLCAFFLLRASNLLRKQGSLGFLTVDTIAQGDTARTGLLFLTERTDFTVRCAVPSFPWPGKATVVAAWVVLQHGSWKGRKLLNGKTVDRISPILDEGAEWGDAKVFPENKEINFQGSVLAGEGFVLSNGEAADYLSTRKANLNVIFPYLGGNEVNTSPTFAANRWAIDFRDYSLERCEREWPELLERIQRLVKPRRDQANREAHRRFWWQHGDKRPALYARIRKNEHVFVLTRHTKHLALARVSTRQVFQESLCILDLPNWTAFAAIQSTLHYAWAKRGSSTLGEGLRYTPSDYFDTFPFLHLRSDELERIGERYYVHRRKTMLEFEEGFTDIYNRFHSPEDSDERIAELRELHCRMDEAVAAAYGWDDLKLDHDFHQVGYLPANDRIRFTISEQARIEVLRRLSLLNRERYNEENPKTPSTKKSKTAKRTLKKAKPTPLIEEE